MSGPDRKRIHSPPAAWSAVTPGNRTLSGAPCVPLPGT